MKFFLSIKTMMKMGTLACLAMAGCRQGTTHSSPMQETDDRPGPRTKALLDQSALVTELVNRVIADARKSTNPHKLPWTPTLRAKFVEEVGRGLAATRPGSGIGLHWCGRHLEISLLTEIEAQIIERLSQDGREILKIPFKESRYGDNPVGLTKALFWSHVTPHVADHSISPIIRIKKSLVGVDKIGHFAEEGLWYYRAEQEGLISNEKERWELGQFMEGDPAFDPQLHEKYRKIFGRYCKPCVIFGGYGYFGMASTGVASHADMMANEAGYRFYKGLYANPDRFTFDFKFFPVDQWNEEVKKNIYDPRLKVRP